MVPVKTRIFSSFSKEEGELLQHFKKEVFYFVGEDISNFNFWQQYFNLFFIYHYNLGNNETFAKKHKLEPGGLKLYTPSRFARMKGEAFFTEEKYHFGEDEEDSLTWYKDRELILSFFNHDGEEIQFVESRTSLLISMKHLSFFKKIKKMYEKGSFFNSHIHILFLISLLLLKKERYSSSKLYDPFVIEEIEKLNLYYEEKFAEQFID